MGGWPGFPALPPSLLLQTEDVSVKLFVGRDVELICFEGKLDGIGAQIAADGSLTVGNWINGQQSPKILNILSNGVKSKYSV